MMKTNVENYIAAHGLIKAGDRILIGVSGGADSTALLYFLHSLPEVEVAAAHLHHGIRGAAADGDQAFVEDLCRRLSVPCFTRAVDVPSLARADGLSLEEAGRNERYRFFTELQETWPHNKLATAHHLDDQAETILARLIRGTGLTGAAGIAPKSGTTPVLIRPFLSVTKAEILSYLTELGATYRSDATNDENDQTRNRLRNEILPLLAEINPRVSEHLATFGEIAGAYDAHLDNEIKQLTPSIIKKRGDQVFIDRQKYLALSPLERQLMLREAAVLIKGALIDLAYNHIQSLDSQISSENAHWELHLPHGLRAQCRYDELTLSSAAIQAEEAAYQLSLPLHPEVKYFFSKAGIILNITVTSQKLDEIGNERKKWGKKYFAYDRIENALTIRTRLPGDYFYPQGMEGRKKLKDYFIDRKIPRAQRDEILLLAQGSEILWIIGHDISRHCAVCATTTRTLVLEARPYGNK